MESILNLLVAALGVALLALVTYGGWLVLGGATLHGDAPEDTALPQLDAGNSG